MLVGQKRKGGRERERKESEERVERVSSSNENKPALLKKKEMAPLKISTALAGR